MLVFVEHLFKCFMKMWIRMKVCTFFLLIYSFFWHLSIYTKDYILWIHKKEINSFKTSAGRACQNVLSSIICNRKWYANVQTHTPIHQYARLTQEKTNKKKTKRKDRKSTQTNMANDIIYFFADIVFHKLWW